MTCCSPHLVVWHVTRNRCSRVNEGTLYMNHAHNLVFCKGSGNEASGNPVSDKPDVSTCLSVQ